MNISENEAHSAIYCSENEYFARRCRHYKAKESKAECLPQTFSGGVMAESGVKLSFKFPHSKIDQNIHGLCLIIY